MTPSTIGRRRSTISPILQRVIRAIAENPRPAGISDLDPDPDPELAGLCRLINLDSTAKTALGKISNKSPRVYLTGLSKKLAAATATAKAYSVLSTDEDRATTQIAVIRRQVRQLKNRRGQDDFSPRLLELELEREDQQAQKSDDHVRKRFIGGELLDVVGKF